jgi:hypothetical protein
MVSQMNSFEDYVTSLTKLGVFPTLHRNYNGWYCILRNSANRQLMPFNDSEPCWAGTMLEALTIAVDRLNKRFKDPKELRKYIDTGLHQNVETLLRNVEYMHGVNTAA